MILRVRAVSSSALAYTTGKRTIHCFMKYLVLYSPHFTHCRSDSHVLPFRPYSCFRTHLTTKGCERRGTGLYCITSSSHHSPPRTNIKLRLQSSYFFTEERLCLKLFLIQPSWIVSPRVSFRGFRRQCQPAPEQSQRNQPSFDTSCFLSSIVSGKKSRGRVGEVGCDEDRDLVHSPTFSDNFGWSGLVNRVREKVGVRKGGSLTGQLLPSF